MAILAQCLRKERLIERFQMKRNDSSKHLLQKKMKMTLSRARQVMKMCTIARHLKILSEVHKFLEDGHAK